MRRAVHLASLFVLVGLPLTAAAGVPPGDRSRGEEEQIRRRQEWFVHQRGLDTVPRPAELRARAVEAARQMRDQRPEAAGSVAWTSLGPQPATMLDWTMGNVAGRVSALAVHPTDESVLYLGAASGGLWKSTDGGGSWASLFDDIGTQTIGVVALAPGAPDTVWVGTGEQGQNCWSYFGMGLYRSTDGGQTFSPRNGVPGASLDLSYVTGIAVHPLDSNLLVVGGESWCDAGGWYYGGLYRSTDGGATWSKRRSGAVNDVLVDPVSPNIWYAGFGRWGAAADGVYRSTDTGLTWTRLANGIPVGSSVGRIRLAMAPSASSTLYALIEMSGGASLYKSTDSGASWAQTNATACEGQCWYDLCLAVHPTEPATVLVGSIRFARSSDSGVTLQYLTDGWGSTQKVHQDTHVLAFSQSEPKRFWVAGDGGLWRTNDSGVSFVNLNGNLDITQLYDIAVHPEDSGIVFAGAQDNSSFRRSASPLWDVTVVTGDGFMNVVDPASPNLVFQTSYPWDGYPSLCRSTDGGSPDSFWWLVNQGLTQNEPYPWVTPLVACDPGPASATALFLASNRVYRATTNQPWYAFSWTPISSDLTLANDGNHVSVLTPVPKDNRVVLYAGTSNGRIWRSDDALAPTPTFTEVSSGFPAGDYVSDLAVDPTNVDRVFATRSAFGSSRLYRSTSGGASWEPVGSDLPNAPADAVAVDPLEPQRLFVGTDVGVFESTNGGVSFAAAIDGLPLGVVVTDLEVDDDPHVLTVGTYGRGAWQATLERLEFLFSDGFESGTAAAWSDSGP